MTLSELFAEVSIYGIPNASANFYDESKDGNFFDFLEIISTLALSYAMTLSLSRSHLFPTINVFVSLFANSLTVLTHCGICSNDS